MKILRKIEIRQKKIFLYGFWPYRRFTMPYPKQNMKNSWKLWDADAKLSLETNVISQNIIAHQ